MVEREQIIEIVVAVSSVLLMLGVMIGIGLNYGNGGPLSEDGGTMLVAAIVGFIVLMTLVGIAMAFVTNDPEDGLENSETQAS